MNKENNNRYNNIIKDLKSSDKEKVLVAIKQLRKYGQKESIDELLEVFTLNTDEDVKKEITNLLFDLKDEKVISTLIKAINNKNFIGIKPFLISIFWQSSLDASEYLSSFVRWAIKDNYQVCLEVLSVIESFEGTFDEEQVQDAIYDIEEKLDDYEIDEEHAKLLHLLKESISSLRIDF